MHIAVRDLGTKTCSPCFFSSVLWCWEEANCNLLLTCAAVQPLLQLRVNPYLPYSSTIRLQQGHVNLLPGTIVPRTAFLDHSDFVGLCKIMVLFLHTTQIVNGQSHPKVMCWVPDLMVTNLMVSYHIKLQNFDARRPDHIKWTHLHARRPVAKYPP